MKAVITRENMLRAVSVAASVVDAKGDGAILKNILLDCTGDSLCTSGSHLLEEACATGPAEVAVPGSIGVNARDIVDRVKAMPPGTITVSLDDTGQLKLQSGKRRHSLPTVAPDLFPQFGFPKEHLFQVDPAAIVSVLDRVKHCIDSDPSRPGMNGCRIEFFDPEIAAIATDGRALAVARVKIGSCGTYPPILLPSRAVSSVLRLLADEKSVRLGVEGPRLWLQTETMTYGARLLESPFPPYDYATKPSMRPITAKVSRVAFLDACRSSALASEGKERKGLLRLDFSPGAVSVSASGNGAAKDDVDAEYDGPEITIGAYVERVAAALGAIDGEYVRICFGYGDRAAHDPITFLPEEGESTIQIVMPVNLKAIG